MYALIYDQHDLTKPFKEIISVHETREAAEKALEKRKQELGKTVVECDTRIVWLKQDVSQGQFVSANEFENYRPGEKIPEGELYSDTD
jgi:hypothetical protein